MKKELIEFAELLKANGFTVFTYSYTHNPEINYFSFTNGKGFAYVQYERLGGPYSFSSSHVANRTTGTGYRIETDGNLTIENANLACNTLNPNWAKHSDREATKPYRSIEHFLKCNSNCAPSITTITE